MTTQDMKDWIDKATYGQLLSRWRFAPIGSPWFAGEVGDYYAAAMAKRRAEPGGDERHTSASKAIGWTP
jgi:hypothetical protein